MKNTFGEQHTYVFRVNSENKLIQNNCSKKFHVSPFIEMNCKYFFRILNPDEKLSVIIDQYDQEGKILFASQDGKKTDLNSNQLLKSYLKPTMSWLGCNRSRFRGSASRWPARCFPIKMLHKTDSLDG